MSPSPSRFCSAPTRRSNDGGSSLRGLAARMEASVSANAAATTGLVTNLETRLPVPFHLVEWRERESISPLDGLLINFLRE
jgi:hypothetical protein